MILTEMQIFHRRKNKKNIALDNTMPIIETQALTPEWFLTQTKPS